MTRFGEFRKSSHSGAQNECVEVAVAGERLGIRDSKNPDGPVLTWPRATLGRLVAAVAESRPAG
ncbi:DUF397 domain-containing protein [Saccharothrix sp. NRRL B-16314]|uniref:DUF397 domain-containing protein n=1 Tax=Saccharothrix sp. NRRL B-16314 TaxID=1463825 RepID=UPI000526688D|nr:DUF397 domain-containing protein [Saccharothrix sp. NRRL B-16314]